MAVGAYYSAVEMRRDSCWVVKAVHIAVALSYVVRLEESALVRVKSSAGVAVVV